MLRPPPTSTLFPYTTLFRSSRYRTVPSCSSIHGSPHVWRTVPFAASPTESFSSQSTPISPTDRSASATRTTAASDPGRSEEHTSELQSRLHLVCRLLLEKKK